MKYRWQNLFHLENIWNNSKFNWFFFCKLNPFNYGHFFTLNLAFLQPASCFKIDQQPCRGQNLEGGEENCRLSDVDLHYAVLRAKQFLACFMTARGQARIKLIYQLWTITVYTLPLSPPEPITNRSEHDPRPRSTENPRFIATTLTNEMKIFLSMKTGTRKTFFASKEGWRGARGIQRKVGKGKRQALKNYPIMTIALHETDWKALDSTLLASIDVNMTHFSASIILAKWIFHEKNFSRPCSAKESIKCLASKENFIFQFLPRKTQISHLKYRNIVGPTVGPEILSISAFNSPLIHEL